MTAAVLAGVFFAATAGPPPAAGAADARGALSSKARAAFDILVKAGTFESSHVNEGGELSRYARAVRTLIREREAPAAFQALYDNGTPVAALYALAAFWYLRPDDFPALLRRVRERYGARTIETQSGCIGAKQKVADLLESRERNGVRLPPGSGRTALLCATAKLKGFTEDFLGGGVPIDIVEEEPKPIGNCAHPEPLPDYLKPRR
jgi:hypothetical protein